MNANTRLGLLALVAALSACSTLEGDKIDYKSATKGSTLEVPPDLTQLAKDSRYAVPGGTVSAAALQAGQQAAQPTAASQAAATSIGDVRIERDGNQRWLVVNRPADKLWEPVREFWLENGFIFTQDQANLGILETDWAENRAKLPQDVVRAALGKVFDSLYSTGERDKFRTRLERNANGGTDIFISHAHGDHVGGLATTIYLHPRDYHRVHCPCDADVRAVTAVPGRLLPVTAAALEREPRLFARNERLIHHLDTALGAMAVVMVAAFGVGHMSCAYRQVAVHPRQIQRTVCTPPVRLRKGDELGVFHLGSTVVLLTRPGVELSDLDLPISVRMGEALLEGSAT